MKMFAGALLGPLLCLLVLTLESTGYSFYADRLPNGDHVPHPCKPNYPWHGVGHQNALGGGVRNQFGKDFLALGSSWTQALCQKDSDGDGLTNGQELGDPDCVWTPGNLSTRTTSITHPGVCDPWDDPKCRENNTWVTCDVKSFHCNALQNDTDMKNLTLRFPSTPVPNLKTNYFCMTFDLPSDDTYHLVATEPYIDNADVLHHILVYGCEGDDPPTISQPTLCGMKATSRCNDLIGLWQVGYTGSCTDPRTGFPFGKGEFTRITMEIHWNNPELRRNYTDSSGMRFFYTPNLRDTSAVTLMVGQRYLQIPPLQPSVQVTGTCSDHCTSVIFNQPVYVVDGSNHMHYLGISQKVELFRNNSLVAMLTNDETYSYDSPVQHRHDPPIQVLPGDEIRTTCEFSSKYKDTVTYYGDGTSDEMCWAFLTVYPREALGSTRRCIAYNEHSVCGEAPDMDLDGCDFTNLGSIPGIQGFFANVSGTCHPFGPCMLDCQRVMDPMKDDPCLKGRAFEKLREFLVKSKEGLYFLAQLMSCQPTTPCRQCPTCPANNYNDEETGDAVTVAPGLLSVALFLAASLFFK